MQFNGFLRKMKIGGLVYCRNRNRRKVGVLWNFGELGDIPHACVARGDGSVGHECEQLDWRDVHCAVTGCLPRRRLLGAVLDHSHLRHRLFRGQCPIFITIFSTSLLHEVPLLTHEIDPPKILRSLKQLLRFLFSFLSPVFEK